MKTGNTSIHYHLVNARARGFLGQVSYPLWGEDKHQARMAVLYCADTLSDKLPSLRERYPQNPVQFRHMLHRYRRFVFRELKAAGSAIISAEAFCHLFTAKMAMALRRDLAAVGFERFVILLYVRDPADYYLSITNQNLRMSEALPLVKDPASFRYNFLEMADAWEEAFPGALMVRRYPPQATGDAVADFNSIAMQTFGIELPSVSIKSNASLSAEGMQLLQNYRAAYSSCSRGIITSEARDLVRLLLGSAAALRQTRPVLKKEVARQIRHNHKADLDALCLRYGVNFYPDTPPLTTLAPRVMPYRVIEIVDSVDPQILEELGSWVTHEVLRCARTQRSFSYRLAAAVNQQLPSRLRSSKLAAALKSVL
jgi:hypothetical protein